MKHITTVILILLILSSYKSGVEMDPLMEVEGTIRSTHFIDIPSQGEGLEMYYHPSQKKGVVFAYDRTINQYKPIQFGRGLWMGANGNVRLGGTGTDEPTRQLHITDAMRLEPISVAPSNPMKGDMYFGTDGFLHLYDGTNWNTVNMTPE